MSNNGPFLWYRDKESLKIGGVSRYRIRYKNIDTKKTHIYFRLKNIEKTSIRAIHLLNGPFILYCHVVPYNYDHRRPFKPTDAGINKEVVFENQIKPGQTFNVRLELNENSFIEKNVEDYPVYGWSIDVVSQIVITRNTSILYDFMIGDDIHEMRNINTGALQYSLSLINRDLKSGTLILPGMGNSVRNSDDNHDNKLGKSTNPNLTIDKQLVEDLWATRPKDPHKPIHLVIVTHGIFSNLTADMLYLKDTIESNVEENVVVKGYKENAGKTERGVKKLGINVSNYLKDLIKTMTEDQDYQVDKISFIGHSLGGLVQLYAIKHLLLTEGVDYFDKRKIQPTNLTFMASPLLGVLSEMSFLISWFLDMGTLGKTGRDLTLLKRIPNPKQIKFNLSNDMKKRGNFKPLLEVLPDDPLQNFIEKFERLTLYANAINDGIVPLRTSALLYLDYEALGDVTQLRKERRTTKLDHTGGEEVGEVPEENERKQEEQSLDGDDDKKGGTKDGIASKYWDFFWLNFTSPFEPKNHKNGGVKTNLQDKKKKLTKREKKFLKITAKGSDYYKIFNKHQEPESSDESRTNTETSFDNDNNKDSEDYQDADFENKTLNIPPKASAVESAINTVLCPIPKTKYILEPESRDEIIFHDKFYHFENLPSSINEDSKGKKVYLNYHDWKMNKQVKIAKKYHTPNMNWRKVLVSLPPDAHNNIVVRRRFANGYGWGVVDHLCNELFDTSDDLRAKI